MMNRIIDYDKEIVSFLKRNYRQMFSAYELSIIFRMNYKNMNKKLKMLEKYGFIESNLINKKIAAKIYGSNVKRGLNLYCIAEEG